MSRLVALRPARLASRLGARHPLAIGVVTLALAAVLAYLGVVSVNGLVFTDSYRIRAVVPGDAPVIKTSDEVRVAGRTAGLVTEVAAAPEGRLVTMDLKHGDLGRDARVLVRQRGFAGSVYLDIQPGDVRRPLPEGATLPRDRTGSGVELSAVVAGFDTDARRALGRTLATYGGGLIGRGEDLNGLLEDAAPLARDGTGLIRAMTPRPGELSGLLGELDRMAGGFAAPGEHDLGNLVTTGRRTLEVTSDRRLELERWITEARPLEDAALEALPVAESVLDDAAAMARELAPGMRALGEALPSLNGVLGRARELRALSRLSRAANPVLEDGERLVAELRPVAASLDPLARPLNSFAGYLAPYGEDMVRAFEYWKSWGGFRYPDGQAPGSRAVRFNPVFTCHRGRGAYPRPGDAFREEAPCD